MNIQVKRVNFSNIIEKISNELFREAISKNKVVRMMYFRSENLDISIDLP